MSHRKRAQEINAEYWKAREKLTERVAVAQLTLALALSEQEAEQERPLDAPFVVRQFEGKPWVPLHEAARLHDAHQAAELRVAALRNELAEAEQERPLDVERLQAQVHRGLGHDWPVSECGGCFDRASKAIDTLRLAALAKPLIHDEPVAS